MKPKLTQSALRDCQEILDWFERQGDRDAGAAVVTQLLARIEQLERFPHSGRIVPEFQQPQLRELIESPYRIVDRVGDRSLTVIRVWRGERELQVPHEAP